MTDAEQQVNFYNEYFTRAEHSRAHATFCERVYGRNLCQHGMMDMDQLQTLIEILGLAAHSHVLELGCGNGMVAEYISDTTMASVTGVDISTVGIAQAQQRTSERPERLSFIAGDMNAVDLPPVAFDTVLAIDSVYFVPDLDRLLKRLRTAVVRGGQMGVFSSAWAGADEPKEQLLASETRFAQALRRAKLSYEVWDFSRREGEHWTRKLQVLRELRQDFEAEGNEFLYQRRLLEAESHQEYVAAGNVQRFLYTVSM
jgi:cyclopropane fatty-acyl-phospholipid synthase-like methyltransferase